MLKHPGRIVYRTVYRIVQVRHTETQYWSHQNSQGLSHTGVWHLRVLFTAGKCQRSPGKCQHKASYPNSVCKWEDIKQSCQLSCWLFFWALGSPLECVPGTTHSTICVLGSWIPVFWPQKMTSVCVLGVPSLQSQGSLAAVPCDADRAFNYLVTQCFLPTKLLCLSRDWDGWCFSNEHLFSIWFSPPFAACGSRDHYSSPAMNTELLICLWAFLFSVLLA